MPHIEFDENAHTYTVDGTQYPSVTTVLKSAGLIDTKWFTEEGRDRGTYVSQATAWWELNQLDNDSLDPELEPYLSAWVQFLHDSEIDVQQIEHPVCHPMGFAGTPDRVVFHPTLGSTVIDIKTGGKSTWHALQLAAYAECLGPRFCRMNVYLSPDCYSVYIHDTPQQRDFDVFRCALGIHNWKESR